MSLVRVAAIGEMACELDIVLDQVVGITITSSRKAPPRFVLYDDTGREEWVPTLETEKATAAVLPSPKATGTAITDHPRFGRAVRLVLPPFAFYEHD